MEQKGVSDHFRAKHILFTVFMDIGGCGLSSKTKAIPLEKLTPLSIQIFKLLGQNVQAEVE